MDRMPQVSMPPVEMEPFDNDNNTDDELVQAESDRQYSMIPEELEQEFKEAAVKDPEPEEDEPPEKVRLDNKDIFKQSKGDADMKVNKVKKPKRVISEEHKERLRKGRETALANRRAKAKAKKEAKDKPPDPPELKLEPKVEFKPEPEVKEVIKEVIVEKEVNKGLSKDEVMELVSQASRKAVEDSEILRKQRKAEKLKAMAEEEERKRISQVIKRATTPGLDSNNPWANCY